MGEMGLAPAVTDAVKRRDSGQRKGSGRLGSSRMCFSGPRERSEEARRRIEEDRAGMDGGQLGWNLMTGEARGGRGN